MKRKLLFLFLLLLSAFLVGMAGGRGGGELRPEIRLKIFDEAIRHYEKAEALHRAGERGKALTEIRKATKVISAFPEAYALARQIYLELGDEKKAKEQEGLFQVHGGTKGNSLYLLRAATAAELKRREASMPPPDFQPWQVFLASAGAAALLIFGMIFEYRRLVTPPSREGRKGGILLEKFPGEEEQEISPSWVLKGCALVLPAPFLASLVVGMGIRYWTDFYGPFFLAWGIVSVVIYTVFFADLSGFTGFRRPGAGA